MIQINQIKLQPIKEEKFEHLKGRLCKKVSALLHIHADQIQKLDILKESIDARKKNQVFLIYSVAVEVPNEEKIISSAKTPGISFYNPVIYDPIMPAGDLNDRTVHRPVVVGLGPCGLFCGYILALNGYRPILIERGKDVDARQKDVDAYWSGEPLDTDSNVQFGEGGAGTFSDGKLNTQIKDPDGRIRFVIDTFVSFGANEKIQYSSHPHVGTDVLKNVVRNLRNEIIRLGGEVRFSSKLTDIGIDNGKVCKIEINGKESIPCRQLILAIGHSSRDTFEWLKNRNIGMQPKEFAVGYRVCHPQDFINVSQYGENYADCFEAAPYKLTARSSEGRGVYTFCMCPGGYVVDASGEVGRLCVNGMSYQDRGSQNANSAVIVSVGPEDFKKAVSEDKYDDPLIGMYFQRKIEENTYQRANGKIPVQKFGSFCEDLNMQTENTYGKMYVKPIVKGRIKEVSLKGIYPFEIEKAFVEGMDSFSRKIKGFNHPDVLIMASETRTSSPVRITRDERGMSSVEGLFPAGEGAGYAGGITSAAVDGIRVAEYVMKNY